MFKKKKIINRSDSGYERTRKINKFFVKKYIFFLLLFVYCFLLKRFFFYLIFFLFFSSFVARGGVMWVNIMINPRTAPATLFYASIMGKWTRVCTLGCYPHWITNENKNHVFVIQTNTPLFTLCVDTLAIQRVIKW